MRAIIAELPNSETYSGPLGTKCAVEASMDGTNTLSRLTDQRVLDPIAEPLSRAIRGAYELAGPVGRRRRMPRMGSGCVIHFIQYSRICRSAHGRPASFST